MLEPSDTETLSVKVKDTEDKGTPSEKHSTNNHMHEPVTLVGESRCVRGTGHARHDLRYLSKKYVKNTT